RTGLIRGVVYAGRVHTKVLKSKHIPGILDLIERHLSVKRGPTTVSAVGACQNVIAKAKCVKVLGYVPGTLRCREPGKAARIDRVVRDQQECNLLSRKEVCRVTHRPGR